MSDTSCAPMGASEGGGGVSLPAIHRETDDAPPSTKNRRSASARVAACGAKID
jgi:hypothetical protein